MKLDSVLAELDTLLSTSEQRYKATQSDFSLGYHAGLSAAVGVLRAAINADAIAAAKAAVVMAAIVAR